MRSELDETLMSSEFLPYVKSLIDDKIKINKDSKKINITINHLKSGYITDISCILSKLKIIYSDWKINCRRDTGQGYDFTIINIERNSS